MEKTKTVKAAIVLNDWKLPIFKRGLDKEGYQYTKHRGPTPDTLVLKIETDDLERLKPIVEKMNQDAGLAVSHQSQGRA